jgi:Protein of unknown function (DUF1761)
MFEVITSHYVAILVAAVVQMILGGLWYSPKCFGAKWAEIHGFDESSLKTNALHYLGAFVNALVISWVLGCMLLFFEVTTIPAALCLSFWIWLGFVATTQFSGVIWAKKPFGAYLIDVGFFLIALLSTGLVFGLFFWWFS